MRLLDRYIVLEQVKIFILATSLLLGVLLLEKVHFLSDLLLTKGASFGAIGKMLIFLVPSFFSLAAPLATLMSSLMVFSRFSADNEITAMRASGVSLYRLLLPVGLVAVVAFAATLYLSLAVAHKSNYAFRMAVLEILKSNLNLDMKERRFNDRFDGYLIHFEEKKGDVMKGVFISDQRNKERSRIIEAAEGVMESDREDDAINFILRDGVIHTLEGADVYQTIAFDRYTLRIDLKDEAGQSFEKEIPHLSPAELRRRINTIDERVKEGEKIKPPFAERVALYQKYAAPVGCIALGLLGAPLGMLTNRRGKSGGFGIGVVMIICNYILWVLGQGLGSEGKLPPLLGVWGPNFVMGGLASLLILLVAQDAVGSRTDALRAIRLFFRKREHPHA